MISGVGSGVLVGGDGLVGGEGGVLPDGQVLGGAEGHAAVRVAVHHQRPALLEPREPMSERRIVLTGLDFSMPLEVYLAKTKARNL